MRKHDISQAEQHARNFRQIEATAQAPKESQRQFFDARPRVYTPLVHQQKLDALRKDRWRSPDSTKSISKVHSASPPDSGPEHATASRPLVRVQLAPPRAFLVSEVVDRHSFEISFSSRLILGVRKPQAAARKYLSVKKGCLRMCKSPLGGIALERTCCEWLKELYFASCKYDDEGSEDSDPSGDPV
jgi:hypothetical protein